jgi:hypothetical protein
MTSQNKLPKDIDLYDTWINDISFIKNKIILKIGPITLKKYISLIFEDILDTNLLPIKIENKHKHEIVEYNFETEKDYIVFHFSTIIPLKKNKFDLFIKAKNFNFILNPDY